MSAIPVIDIGEFLAGGDGSRAAAEIGAAAVTVGFFQVIGHGVDPTLLDAAYNRMRAVSALPIAAKDRLMAANGHPYRGLHLNRDREGVVRQERFLASRFDDPAAAIAGGVDPQLADYFYPNSWPTEVPAFRTDVGELFTATQRLAGRIMQLFALALELGPDGFDGVIEPNSSGFAINYYPPRNEPLPHDPTVIFDEHSDGNTLTILHQRGDYEGLQVQRLDAGGTWTPVPVRDDAFVINLGELMTRWTNDHWPATRHRVVASSNPEAQRTTITTFHMPSLDTVIAPLPQWGGDTDPHYEPVTTDEWERRFIRRGYTAPSETTEHHPKVYEFAASLDRGSGATRDTSTS